MGAKDFFIGGDLNTELNSEGGEGEFRGFDSLDWSVFMDPNAKEDVTTW